MQERNVHLQSSVRLESYEEKRAKVRQFNLTSDIFFGKVMEDKAACQELIRILTKEKLTVKEVKTQYSIRNVENHSVVLDVLAEDENGKVINVEIHPQEDEDHVKRVRYYLGSIDMSFLEKGCPFENLPEVYLIYITEKDFIGKDLAIYHVDRILRDCEELLDNGVHEIYVNLQADAKEPAQQELLRYIRFSDRAHETPSFPHLADRVYTLKEKKEGVEIMCSIIERERAEGKAEGKIESMRLVVRNMLKRGISEEEICALAECTKEFVEEMRKS